MKTRTQKPPKKPTKKSKPPRKLESGQNQTSSDEADSVVETLNPRQLKAVELLASGASVGDTCRGARISDRTLRRWRCIPEMQQAIRARLNEGLSTCRALLAQGSAAAARALVGMAKGRPVAKAARVSAARSVIDLGLKSLEIDELQAKLLELEARLDAQGNV